MNCQVDNCDEKSENILKISFETNTFTIKLCDEHKTNYERCDCLEHSICNDQFLF